MIWTYICHLVSDTCQKDGVCFLSFGTLRNLYRTQFQRFMGKDHASACLHLLVEHGVLLVASRADYNNRHAVGYTMVNTVTAAATPPNRYVPPTRVELSNRGVYRPITEDECVWPVNQSDYDFLEDRAGSQIEAVDGIWVEMEVKGIQLRIQLSDASPEKVAAVELEMRNCPKVVLRRMNGWLLFR